MEEALRSSFLAAPTLSALVGTRVDWGLNVQGSKRPSIRLTLVSRVRDTTFKGRSGFAATRVQIDCFGDKFADAKTLARKVVALTDTLWPHPFMGAELSAERDAPADDQPTPIFTTSLDLMVWHNEP